MRPTLHIIRKDLNRSRWALSLWALGLGYLFVQSQAPAGSGNMKDYLQISAMLIVVVLGSGLIADIVQVDHPTRDDSHWRTLPISPGRLASAKLLLIGGVFVVTPVAAALIRNLVSSNQSMRYLDEYALALLVLSAVALSLTAVAACTQNFLQCLAVWLVLIFGTGALGSFLDRFSPVLGRPQLARMGMEKVLVILTLSVTIALAVILNQYLRRRPGVSVVLLLIGAVGSALIGSMWGYFYFYQS